MGAQQESLPPPKKIVAPTVAQINAEFVTQLANKFWAPHVKKKLPFDSKVIEDVYGKEIVRSKLQPDPPLPALEQGQAAAEEQALCPSHGPQWCAEMPSNDRGYELTRKHSLVGEQAEEGFAIRKIMLLEFSQYLENYLWMNYSSEVSSKAYLMSICCMVNEKFRENVPAWETFKRKPEHFPFFFKCVLEASLAENDSEFSLQEQTILLLFLDHCFNSLEVDLIRAQVQQLISLPMWMGLQPARLELELKKTPKLRKFWNLIKKTDEKMDENTRLQAHKERLFLSQLIQKFISVLKSIPISGSLSMDKVHYCERFIELMIDLEPGYWKPNWHLPGGQLQLRGQRLLMLADSVVYKGSLLNVEVYVKETVTSSGSEPKI
ncbi:UNVERIFIED_CONTAM: hypothetical protein K2H54_045627 [Gekko kuhli]